MPRCVSKCSGLKEEDCKVPCSFVAKKYCRLSRRKMNACEFVNPPATKAKPRTKTVKKPIPDETVPIEPITVETIPDETTVKPATKRRKKIIPNETVPIETIPVKIATETITVETIPDENPVKPATKTRKKPNEKPVKPATKKVNKKIPNETPIKIGTRSRTLKKSPEFHARIIQKFMKKTEGRRKALFYGTICSDSGVCLALGKEKQKLLDFFKFDTFEYTKEITSIGEESAHGFVKELKYESEGYIAYALLKSSLRSNSDNLAYEYLVGRYLNEVSKPFPTFIQTYGLFHYPSVKDRNQMKEKGTFSKRLVPMDPTDIRNACIKSGNLCILSQYLKNTKTFQRHSESMHFREHLSAHVFYQIYFTLHQLRKEFTHYDLHLNNVMLYEPDEKKYIQYHYHTLNRTVSFKSSYLAKMIDYGHCFIKDSSSYYDKVCKESRCDPNCGLQKGFSNFHLPLPRMDRENVSRAFGHINSLYKNESHDLRMLYIFYNEINKVYTPMHKDYYNILKDTIYMKSLSGFSGPGTIEDLRTSSKIHNVSDAYRRLEDYISHPDRIRDNEKNFVNYTCLGDLHIYTDGRDLEFIQHGI